MSENKKIGNANNDKKQNTVIIQRCLKLLEYFRRNTDSEHTVTQIKMREDEIDEYMGNKTSFNKMMKNMAIALNFDDGFLKPSSDRRLLFRDFSMMYDEYEELADVETVPIKDIYYNHEFTQGEVQDIIIALRTSRFINAEYAEKLIDKIKTELASKYFCDSFAKIYNREYNVSEKLVDNLSAINDALINHNRLTFSMNYYNDKKQLITYGKRLTVSPDLIIVNRGRFYLVGCFENENDEKKNLAIIRIDLMSDIQILKLRVTSTYDIPSLRQIISEYDKIDEDKFRTFHLNMSYNDDYLFVEMKIRKTPKTNNEVNYTFIHDSFGDQYKVLSKEVDGDIVRVHCSKYGIVNWAVQYGDFVKVLSPDSVIEEIKKKIEMLKSKYFKEEDFNEYA